MKKAFPIFLLAAVSISGFIFQGCAAEDSTDVNQDRIHAVYEIFYNANTDKSQVVARFRFGHRGGTILEVTDGSGASVTFNGEPLSYNGLAGGHFKEYAGRIGSGEFVYTNTDGDIFKNTVPKGDTVDFPSSLDTIKRGKAQTMTWVGNALGNNEYVSMFVGSAWVWGDDALFVQAQQGEKEIVMGILAKANLATGPAKAFMERVYEGPAGQTGSAGGLIRHRYRPVNKAVVVVD